MVFFHKYSAVVTWFEDPSGKWHMVESKIDNRGSDVCMYFQHDEQISDLLCVSAQTECSKKCDIKCCITATLSCEDIQM